VNLCLDAFFSLLLGVALGIVFREMVTIILWRRVEK